MKATCVMRKNWDLWDDNKFDNYDQISTRRLAWVSIPFLKDGYPIYEKICSLTLKCWFYHTNLFINKTIKHTNLFIDKTMKHTNLFIDKNDKTYELVH